MQSNSSYWIALKILFHLVISQPSEAGTTSSNQTDGDVMPGHGPRKQNPIHINDELPKVKTTLHTNEARSLVISGRDSRGHVP